MPVTVGSIMRHCRNYFERGYYDGECVVKSGALVTPALADGRYIAISGSVFNDGVYKLGTDVFTEETFTGRVWLLSPPAPFLALCTEIAEYDAKNPAGAHLSETFGEYSYSRSGVAWQAAFSSRLAAYQLLYSEVMV